MPNLKRYETLRLTRLYVSLISTFPSHLPFFLHGREHVELTLGVCRMQELRKQFQVISELRSEIKNLQADNLKLYEKVRYMQSYREEAGSRPPTSQLDPLPAPAGSGTGLDDMGKYRARYEEAMNPFEAFRGRVGCHAAYRGIFMWLSFLFVQEATRAYQNLNPIERGVLVLTRAILGNRRARTFFICYAIALHLLVMFTTYECTTSSGTHLQKQASPYGS